MSDTKMRPEDLPMWLPLREGCEWDSIFNMHECFDPEYDALPLVLLRLAFWAFAVSPRFLWWLLVAFNFRRLINTSRAVVFLQFVSAAALCLIPWIWQSDYSRLRSQTEPFFGLCWQLWLLLSSPNILFLAYHSPGTIRDGIVSARDYAYRCMDLEILFPEPGEWDLDADPRDTDGEAFFRKLLAEDRERRLRRECEEQATREHLLAMREQEREVREREVVRQKELEDRRRQRERRDEAARQEDQRRGYDPDAAFTGLAAIFRRADRRWRPRVPEPEPELELARVKVQDPRSKGSRKVIAFYSRGTQTETRDLPGERASGEASSSRYVSIGVQTDSMTEEKQHKAPASKPQEKAASSPARDPQPSRPTPTPAPESPMVKPTDEGSSEEPQPLVSASPKTPAPRSSASRQLVKSPTTLLGARTSTSSQGRRPRSHVKATGPFGRRRPRRLFGSPAVAGGRVDETPSKESESSTLEGEQVQEQAADTTTAAAAAAPADQTPVAAGAAPDTASSSFKRPEDFDDFEEWFNSSPPPFDFDGTGPFALPLALASGPTSTSSNDLPGSPDDDEETMALGDLLRRMSLRDDGEVRSASDLMDLESNQDPEESTVGQEQLASEMEDVVGDDSGDAGPLDSISPEMDWEGEEGPDVAMCDVEAPPAPPAALFPSTAAAPSTTLAGPTTPAAPTTLSPALPRSPSPKNEMEIDELDELERDLIAAFEETTQAATSSDLPQEASQAEMAKRQILKPRSRRSKDTGSTPSLSRETTLQSLTPTLQPRHIIPSSTAANEPAHIPASQNGSLTLQGGNNITNSSTPTPSSQPQQNTPVPTAAHQPAHIPASQNGSLNLPGGNITTNPSTSTPSLQSQQSTPTTTAANEPAHIPADQNDSLILSGGNNITNPSTPTPSLQPQQDIASSTAANQPAHNPADQNDSLILQGGNNTTNSSILTPTPQRQQNVPSSSAANQQETVPAIQMGGLTLPGGNTITNTPTPTPSTQQQQDTAASTTANKTENIPAVQMGGLILPGGNITTTAPTPTPSPQPQSTSTTANKHETIPAVQMGGLILPGGNITTTAPTPTPSPQPQSTSTAANQPTHIPSIQMGGLNLPGGNPITNTPTQTAPRQQQNASNATAASQPEHVPSIQMGGLILPGGNRIANAPTLPPPRPQPSSAGTNKTVHVPAIHMGGLILPGGNSSTTTPTTPKPKGSILPDTLMSDSPVQMTPSQTPGRRDSTPTGTPKTLGEIELQRAIRRQQAKKGKKPQLFHSKKDNASPSAKTSTPTTPVRQGSTDTAMEVESSDAAAERLLSGSNSKKKVTVVQSSTVPQHLRDQERDQNESERDALRRDGDL